ncbi:MULTISPECIES: hypothetical protein [unclassified Enterococcus]|uniref:hypothetical protein n=1 Tax=unclassified Enterococcus TaxID=2608891 RepID=UPI0015570712|nr:MULTISPECIES: hypothetical protein [unclassified Enterococcus]MBS7578127.1 hypothetical protein [Enterococcus sp. MMGLQ5-2]MBS7585387.1 hypothetical protein [Enterococcus sp. MMGLQ5-1]NPD13244.1 hypothetical protein [Enterococcus sp. MMGLQ5-1]NPD37958.1 hypothetical protein [Enterococcus sp. MMGLQ5-2]
MNIIVIILVLYFIKEQFSFNRLQKLNYLFLPVLSIYQVATNFKLNQLNIILLIVTILIGIVVGYYQSRYAQIKRELKPVYIYYDDEHNERKIYKRGILVKGGRSYIVGWIIIFAIQIMIQYLVLVDKGPIQNELYHELLADFFSIYRLKSLGESADHWYVWALYGTSNLFYLNFLCRRHPTVREALFNSDKEILES